MALRLVNRDATKTIVVEGTTITIRQLTAADMMMLAEAARIEKGGDVSFRSSQLLPVVARGIVSIEGHEDRQPLEVLESIESPATLSQIVTEVTAFSRMSEAQAKNSNASPRSRSEGSAGSAGKDAVNTIAKNQ
jgi:hypothetical protein